MANQGRVREGELVLDAFVGTGSILVAAAHFKCMCFGTEIDFRVIRGKGVGRKNPKCNIADKFETVNVYSNFDQYGFDRPEILRMDCMNGMFKEGPLFDAIVCDPPYGIRASARESGLKEKRVEKRAKAEERLKSKTEEEKAMIEKQLQDHTYVAPALTLEADQSDRHGLDRLGTLRPGPPSPQARRETRLLVPHLQRTVALLYQDFRGGFPFGRGIRAHRGE
jgi:tRNA G10  N-methylase Trm11